MGINTYLLPIKFHFFLRLGSSGVVLLLLPLVMQQKGLSSQAIGLMYSVLPIIGLIISSIAGPMADYYKAHRAVFFTSIVSLTIGLFGFYFVPPLPTLVMISANDTLTQTVAYQDFIITYKEKVRDIESLMQVIDVESVEQESILPKKLQLENSEEILWDTSTDYMEQGSAMTNKKQGNDFEEVLQVLNVDYVGVAESKSINTKVESKDRLSLTELMMQLPFWLMVLCMFLVQSGVITCVMMEETACFLFLGCEREKFGQQRLWGTVSIGIMSVNMGAAVDLYSKNLPEKDYFPVFLIFLILSVINLVVVFRMDIPAPKRENLSISAISSTIRRRNVILFLLNVLVGGFSLSTIWIYRLILIEEVSMSWDRSFPALKLLQGVALATETFAGEVPCLFFAGSIIKRFGHSRALTFGMMCLALRCGCYFFITNPWYILPVELLNGPSWGLYAVAMASFASEIAPPGAQATMQSVVKTVFMCGWSLQGFIVGKVTMEVGISKTFLFLSAFITAFTVVYIICNFVVYKEPKEVNLLGKNIAKEEKGHLEENIKSYMSSIVIVPVERKDSYINEGVIQDNPT